MKILYELYDLNINLIIILYYQNVYVFFFFGFKIILHIFIV